MAIEIVSFPIITMVIFHGYVSSPKGTPNSHQFQFQIIITNQWIWRPNALGQSSALSALEHAGNRPEPMSCGTDWGSPGSVEFLLGSLDEYWVSIN